MSKLPHNICHRWKSVVVKRFFHLLSFCRSISWNLWLHPYQVQWYPLLLLQCPGHLESSKFCPDVWQSEKEAGNSKLLQKRVGKLPKFSKNRWKKLVLIDNKSLCGRKWKRKEFQGHSWISSSFQPRHFFQLIRKYFEENSQNQILVFSSFTI